MKTKTQNILFPMLSFHERDRRFNLARKMMAAQGVDCLIVAGGGFDEPDAWFTNDSHGGTVVFPLKGEPVYLVHRAIHGITATEVNRRRGILPWIENYQAWENLAEGLISAFKSLGLEKGVIGLAGHWSLVPAVTAKLPDLKFQDAMLPLLVPMTMFKSDEELAMARHSANIGEQACQAMLDVVKPGVGENEVVAAIAATILLHGAHANLAITQTGAGFASLAWGPPLWVIQAQKPPIITKSDLVQSEIFPTYAGIQTQQQMSVATAPVLPLVKEMGAVARRSYEEAIKFIKPGVTFGALCDVMKKPLDEAGCWNFTPLCHSMDPLILCSPMQTMVEELPDLKKYHTEKYHTPAFAREFVLKPGLILELEPNAVRDNQRVNLGGTVIVTETGVEELNHLSTRLNIKS
ncbi:MAG: M24 family metallopeptidase [Dehalococcoidales bacterium]|nr:M24 family metallopeptidase [Dehalococcoidales bacterium]